MNSESEHAGPQTAAETSVCSSPACHELQHLQKEWWWFLLLWSLLVIGGMVAIVLPPLASAGVIMVLGATLIVGGVATIVSSFWAGKWSATLLQLLVGILYLVAGMAVIDCPIESIAVLTLFMAAFFIVVGIFRIIASLTLKFPLWGWALLNGVITLLLGVVIYKSFRAGELWIIGLLVGIELLFNGWTWIMLAFQLRKLADAEQDTEAAATT